MRILFILYYFIVVFVFFSCKENDNKPVLNSFQIKEALIEQNISAVKKEQQQIDNYLKINKLTSIKTATGLRYQIIQEGDGKTAVEGQIAVISYQVTLLDGTVCYSTKENGPEEFTVGKDNVESGLHEAITYLKEGDKAIIIIPSYLAHGLSGDLKKIPIRSTIIYNLELIAVK